MLFYECQQENITYDSYFLNLSHVWKTYLAHSFENTHTFQIKLAETLYFNTRPKYPKGGKTLWQKCWGSLFLCFGTTNLTIFCFHLARVN